MKKLLALALLATPCFAQMDAPVQFSPSGQDLALSYPTLFTYFLANAGSDDVTTDPNNASAGVQSLGIGKWALQHMTTGYNNTAVGALSQWNLTSGYWNTAVGVRSLHMNVTGNYNTAVGLEALRYNTAHRNTAVGANALSQNTVGELNTAVGNEAAMNGVAAYYNTAVGRRSLYANVSGSFNVAVGMQALETSTGSNNTAVGVYSGPTSTLQNTTAIGARAVPTQSNTAVIGDANVTKVSTAQGWAVAGIKVVGAQCAAIADATSESLLATVNVLLGCLRQHGLIAP